MRVLKNVLVGLGALLLVFLALLSWVGVSSSQFRKEQTPFVESFVTDLARRWDLADVRDRLDNALSNRRSRHKVSSFSISSINWAH